MGRWRERPDGEWWEDDLGVVIGVQGTLWFGYPEKGCSRIGPFVSLLDAQRALEQYERSGTAELSAAGDLADDDRPTEKRPRPGGATGSTDGADR
jgi:hypothetical protein